MLSINDREGLMFFRQKSVLVLKDTTMGIIISRKRSKAFSFMVVLGGKIFLE